jgi:TP901 family phage tail tape measure protein
VALPEVGVRAVVENLQAFQRDTKAINKSIASVGLGLPSTQQALGAVTRAIFAFGKAAVQEGREFTAALSNVGAVARLDKLSDEFAALEEQARGLGATTKFTATEAAEGMGFLAMAGFEAAEIIGALPGALNLAAASNLDLAKSADIVSNVLSGFNLTAESTDRFVDTLTKTFTTSNTSLVQLGQAMKFAAPAAASLGLDVADTAAAIGTLGDAGIQGSLAGSSLRGVLLQLASPSAKAQATMDELGISIFDAQGNMLELPAIVGNVNQALRGLTQEQQTAALKTLVGTRQFSAFQVLLNKGEGDLRNYGNELRDSVGTASGIAAKQLDNLEGDLTLFNSALSGLRLDTFDAMEGGLRAVTQAGTDMIVVLSDGVRTWQTTLTQLGAISEELGTTSLAMQTWASATNTASTAFDTWFARQEALLQLSADGVVALVKLAVGGEELEQAVMRAIPPIEDQAAAAEDLGEASEDAASGIEENQAAIQDLQQEIIATSATFVDYKTAVDEVAAGDEALQESLALTADAFDAVKKAASDATLEIQLAKAAEQGFVTPDTARQADAFRQMAMARGKQVELQADFQRKIDQERIDERQKLEEDAAKESAKAFQSSFEGAADNIRGTIESVIKPTLSEVWQPPEVGEGQRMDEAARRLATVATSGFGSEWLDQLNQQFAGQDFFQPIRDAMASGNQEALQAAATDILTNQVTKLWDVGLIKNQVRQQLQQDQLRQQLIDLVQQEMSAEGVQTTFTSMQTAAQDTKGDVDLLQEGMEEAQESTEAFGSDLGAGLETATQQISDFGDAITEMEWPEVGESIVMGIDKGIQDNIEAVRETLKGLARTAVEDVARELGIQSPSTVMMSLMEDFVEGGIIGLDKKGPEFKAALDQLFSVDRSITDPLNAAGAAFDEVEELLEHGGLGISQPKATLILNVAKNVIKSNIDEMTRLGELGGKERENFIAKLIQQAIPNWEKAGIKMTDRLAARVADVFENNFDIFQAENEAALQEMFRDGARQAVAFGNTLLDVANQSVSKLNSDIATLANLVNKGTDVEFAGQMLTAAEAADRLNEMLAERREIQDDLNELQQSQQQLAFLDRQLALLDQIDEAGLNASEILGGIGLGLDASTQDIVEATNAVIQAMIEQINTDLGIASPSKVMFEKFRNVGLGMAEGLASMIPTIQSVMAPVIQPLINQAPIAGNSSVTHNNFNMTVNTTANPRAVIGQFAVMQGMV